MVLGVFWVSDTIGFFPESNGKDRFLSELQLAKKMTSAHN